MRRCPLASIIREVVCSYVQVKGKLKEMMCSMRFLVAGFLFCAIGHAQCSCSNAPRTSIQNLVLVGHPYLLPKTPIKAGRQLSDLPSVVELTIGTNGSVCSINIVRTPEPDLIKHIEGAIRTWTFHAVHREDLHKPTCVVSKVFLYATARRKQAVWDVPGVTDMAKPK
jgi:hypothetical protein